MLEETTQNEPRKKFIADGLGNNPFDANSQSMIDPSKPKESEIHQNMKN